MLQQYPLLPDFLKPEFRVTNEAEFGYAFDETTSPDSLALIQIRAGQLADSGDPRGWQDGELTPIQRHARAYAADHPNATEWYYPRRLLLDFDAASPMRQTPAAKFLGLRLHARRRDRRAALRVQHRTHARARGARREAAREALEDRGSSTIVDDRGTSHLDPLSAAPARNHFLKSVVPFLNAHAAR